MAGRRTGKAVRREIGRPTGKVDALLTAADGRRTGKATGLRIARADDLPMAAASDGRIVKAGLVSRRGRAVPLTRGVGDPLTAKETGHPTVATGRRTAQIAPPTVRAEIDRRIGRGESVLLIAKAAGLLMAASDHPTAMIARPNHQSHLATLKSDRDSLVTQKSDIVPRWPAAHCRAAGL
jgi:hypothetical protein